MSDDIVQQLIQSLEKLDPETRHRFLEAIENLKSVDQAVLKKVAWINEMADQFESTYMGDNQFLDWLLEHDIQHETMELTLAGMLSLSQLFPGFVRATKLLSGLARPN